MRNAGCERAVDSLEPATPRIATWNGITSTENSEIILNRKEFDRALLADAQSGGVTIAEGRVVGANVSPGECRVQMVTSGNKIREFRGQYIVEARGRRAPRARSVDMRGRPSLSLTRRFDNCLDRPQGTCLASLAGGWAWFAATERTAGTLQIVIDGAQGSLTRHTKLDVLFESLMDQIPEIKEQLGESACAVGPVVAREATPYLHAAPISDGVIRVGDASFGFDPLSGHGIFEAVGGGMAVAPVVNTLMQCPRNAELAQKYYQSRARDAFLQHARVGRDFYRSEHRWPEHAFWRNRRGWPDDIPTHPPPSIKSAAIQTVSVIENDFIERREVVVTADTPRGVRFIDSVPLVPLIDLVSELTHLPSEDNVAQKLERGAEACSVALKWLRAQNILGPQRFNVSASQLRDNGKSERVSE